MLEEGAIDPGTYTIMPPEAGWVECMDDVQCAPAPPHARTLQLEITVPPGWGSGLESTVISAVAPETTAATDEAALVIGWYPVGLHSDPCRPVAHSTPDIQIGPTVEDFVEAVLAHPTLEITEPVDVDLGGYPGQFFTLMAPSDISDCADWRPWEHGIPAQGPDNIWNVWVIEVDGLRMVLLGEEFPATSSEDSADLRAMVESIRFLPSP